MSPRATAAPTDAMPIVPAMRAGSTPRERSRALAVLAGRQHGVVAARQLLTLGFTRSAIDRLVAAGRLHRLHNGVFAVGHRSLAPAALRHAAVLSAGPGAVASHTTAAAILDLRPDGAGITHVTVVASRSGARSTPGVRVHRPRVLDDVDVTAHAGIPVTTLARTLVDLGDLVPAGHVRRAFVRAEQLQIIDMTAISAALERAGRRRGPAVLRAVLRAYDPRWQATRSGLELRMLDVLRDAGVPQPDVNAWIAGRWEADLLWRDARLIVEVDGAGVHETASARGRDAVRDRALRRLGYRVLHIAERDLDDGAAVARRVQRALERPRTMR